MLSININAQDTTSVNSRNLADKTTVLNTKMLEQGDYSFDVNASLLPQGISICVVEIDNKTYVRKLLKK